MRKTVCKCLLLCAVILLSTFPVFGSGTQASAAQDLSQEQELIHNNEWVMSVTALDVSSLPPARHILGNVILRQLVQSLDNIDRRVLSDQEIQYYENYARFTARNNAARALSDKQNERGLLLYRGDTGWRYNRNLSNIENELRELEENYMIQTAYAPVINPTPGFRLLEQNTGMFPAAPAEGEEYRYCMDRGADAFLSGSVSEVFGRIYLTLRLYTLYTRSWSWEDSILFSPEDFDIVIAEMSSHLSNVISGIEPAYLTVRANPEQAMIVIDDVWAGRGETLMIEQAPGELIVSVSADNYESEYYAFELFPGDIVDMSFNLTPLALSSFVVDVPDHPGSSVFLGTRFLGLTPLELELPLNQYALISVETPSGETGSLIYHSLNSIRLNTDFVDERGFLNITANPPGLADFKPVETARRNFYSAYGRLWIGLPVSLITMGMASNYINSYNYMNRYGQATQNMFDNAQTAQYFIIGASVVIGLVLTETIYRIFRYISASRTDANPLGRGAVTPVTAIEQAVTEQTVTEHIPVEETEPLQ